MLYLSLKALHILGVVLLIGNVTVTSVWKVFADRTKNTTVIAFAQRLVIGTDWFLTIGGVLLIMLGGYGMTLVGHVNLTGASWLLWGQILFFVSGTIWLSVLLPIQVEQMRLSEKFERTGMTARYQRLNLRWIIWGILATVPLVASMWLMIAKP